ncbi:hypothetical protein MNBD_GAMMA24-1272, partial [hydrothermal vent metagenome]
MTAEIAQETLKQLVANRQLEPFITHIRFPHYKNLEPDTRIDFTYPITAIVGANGTNKSSVLNALYGVPGYIFSIGNRWFATKMDPIAETGERPCIIYGYWNQHATKIVEVIKTRIRKKGDPDYWEPSRPILKYGMEKMPPLDSGQESPEGRSSTRWDNIEKDVVYLDFRGILSAFDKMFYHGELGGGLDTEGHRKGFIKRRSPHLKSAIESDKSSYSWYGERIVNEVNKTLSDEERDAVSTIL